MAARVNIRQARVTLADGSDLGKVAVASDGRTMTFRRKGTVVPVATIDVQAQRKTGRNRWEIDTPDGTVLVQRIPGCGCGG